MTDQQRWQFSPSFALTLAADARFSQTDYTDDQIWEVSPGEASAPALALQTRYGGRVGLASLVPMWIHDGRTIYEAQTYAESPTIVSFTPGFTQLHAKIIPEIELTAEFWAMESHAIGARFTLHNVGTQSITLRLDLFAHVAAEEKKGSLAILTLQDQTNALSLGKIGNSEPIIILENAHAVFSPGMKTSPKIGVDLTIAADEKLALRWVHAGLGKMGDSLERAQFWLAQDWDSAFGQIQQASKMIPQIITGDVAQDTAIAYAYHQLMQSFLRPTDKLPFASFVATRQSHRGWSKRGDGTDYDRAWSGQHPHVAYLVALAVAPIMPSLAQGILKNYLAIQDEDGFVDFKPGLVGQREGTLCAPILARLAWQIFETTQDEEFLKEVFPALNKFFTRWFASDVDTNQNGLPEWKNERQSGYVSWPTFSIGHAWSQGVDIGSVESPDLAAYLVSEARALALIAQQIGNANSDRITEQAEKIFHLLDEFWFDTGKHYAYRDRENGLTSTGITILKDARGDEEQLPVVKISPASRLVVRLTGGTSRPPRASLYLEGLDRDGKPISETIDGAKFTWSYGSGVVTSSKLYAQIDRVRFTGLSRVYRVHVNSVDLTRLDLNSVLPLLALTTQDEKRDNLMNLLIDEKHFWRPSGVSMVSAQDANYDSTSANGGGGVWPYFVAIIGEALITVNRQDLAAELLKRLLKTQAEVLQEQDGFSEFYDSDKARGLGESDYLGGIVPLHLLMQIIGVQITPQRRVWISNEFVWESPIRLTQHNVTVHRSTDGTTINFPDGKVVELPSHAESQWVEPPFLNVEISHIELPMPPDLQAQTQNNRVIIGVQHDSDSS
ncbi:MAG: hypothetical protein H7Y09_08125 [Chitinophagaceae bacterium]|nr:hypothetical protein [Anaerolineae bacterium]